MNVVHPKCDKIQQRKKYYSVEQKRKKAIRLYKKGNLCYNLHSDIK